MIVRRETAIALAAEPDSLRRFREVVHVEAQRVRISALDPDPAFPSSPFPAKTNSSGMVRSVPPCTVQTVQADHLEPDIVRKVPGKIGIAPIGHPIRIAITIRILIKPYRQARGVTVPDPFGTRRPHWRRRQGRCPSPWIRSASQQA